MGQNDFNAGVIEEFRANDGAVVDGPLAGAPILLLHTTGARSGKKRINPLIYLRDGDTLAVFASYNGAEHDPDWFHNLVANPEVTVEIGTETWPGVARITPREERDRLYATQAERIPMFADYERKTDRVIPVVALERR